MGFYGSFVDGVNLINVEFPLDKLLQWYRMNRRDLPWRKTRDIYAIWVSEVMLQQTQVTTVIPYFLRFLETFPTVKHLAEAPEQEVLKQWEGLGYYSRCRNLHRAAQKVTAEYNGMIPESPEQFKALPGVGSYIAAAVLSIARGISLPAVDGNVMRVYTRFRGIDDNVRKSTTRDRIYKELQEIIPADTPGDFNQAVMELGAVVCLPKAPTCPCCPLNQNCTAYSLQAIERYPYKSPLPKIPEYNVSIGIILKQDRLYIQKRPSEGHLGGLWEFPGGKARPGETPAETLIRECQEELGVKIKIKKKIALVHHGYSHFKIHMSVFICGFTPERQQINPREGIEFHWITINELDQFPFPKANHKFFPILREYLQHSGNNADE